MSGHILQTAVLILAAIAVANACVSQSVFVGRRRRAGNSYQFIIIF